MTDPVATLAPRLQDAITTAFGQEHARTDPVLRRSDRADYQANVAMSLAKRLGRPPREVAEAIVAGARLEDVCERVEVAGPGFINLTLRPGFLAEQMAAVAADERLGVTPAERPDTVVVDYSSPNVAKEMHVGHLRATAIGDALARVLDFAGHRVLPQNHLGDWGTQFGMLIEHLADLGWTGHDAGERTIGDLNALYQEAQGKFESDAGFAERARSRVVELQRGDETTLALWRELVDESKRHFEAVYEQMGVLLREEHVRGESFYNPLLDSAVRELTERGLLREDEGALCAFPAGFVRKDGAPLPMIVRKSDGGYGYAATDLAALRFRVRELGATRVVYVVDARQSQHFAMLFAVAAAAGWLDGVRAEHVSFGTVLGPDGRPFRTRSGGTVRLSELLGEGVERAAAAVLEKNPDLDSATRAEVARVIGIGAVKYADLSNDRVKDYVFDWDRMLSFDGNTAPYLQYAHARIRSIFRRGGASAGPGPVVIGEPAERALALQLLAFGEAVASTAETLQPHRLCSYLFELASTFTTFYEHCPVLRAGTDEQRHSRLVLSDVTARVLARGLHLLGIEAPEQM